MEDISKPLALNPDVQVTIEELRAGAEPCRLYDQAPAASEEAVCGIAVPILRSAGLRLVLLTQYMWYLRELSRLLRTRHGPDLAFHLELVLRKWQGLGLEPNTLQVLLAEVYKRVRPQATSLKPQAPNPEQTKAEESLPRKHESANGEERTSDSEQTTAEDATGENAKPQAASPNAQGEDPDPVAPNLQPATCNLQSEMTAGRIVDHREV